MQDLLEKKWDLNYLYDMTQQALEAGDTDQAAKLAKKGIEESELHAEKEWSTKFRELSFVLMKSYKAEEEKKLNAGLTKLKGVGPTHEHKLWEAGYNTIEKIAKSSPKTLACIKGIGIETAKQMVISAQEYLRISNLNDYPKTKQTNLNIQPKSKISVEFEPVKDSRELMIKSKLNGPLDQLDSIKDQTSYHEYLKEEILPDEIKEIPEILDSKAKIIEELTSKGYFSIPLEKIKDQFQDIDELIFKVDSFRQTQHIIFIYPIKFAQIDDLLIISEDSIYYRSQREKNLMINNFAANLTEVMHNIIENVKNKGALFEYIQKFLITNFEVNQNFYESDEVLLNSSKTHYLVHVDPILISLSEIKFLEKSIPFAYQKSSNIHFIQENQVTTLTQFLENKHKFVAEYNTAQEGEITENQANQRFQKQLLRYSLLPFGFGFLTIIVALTQIPSLLLPFIGLSYVILGIYTALVAYLFYIFRVKRKNIRDQYMIHSYQRQITLDEASLEIIYQEFIDDLMLQLGYECFGKSNPYRLLNKIEHTKSELMIKNQLLKPQEKDLEDLFEQEDDDPENKEDGYHAKIYEFLAE
ncbi:MAG: helix-hairpin-helix domain-containing protein [Candidatus Heimdallarchaeota archaeon]